MAAEELSKFDQKVVPAIQGLRQAIAAIERARSGSDCLPHVAACLEAAQGHVERASKHIQRGMPRA